MLDYKSIIIKRYALGLSYSELAKEFGASKSGINCIWPSCPASGAIIPGHSGP